MQWSIITPRRNKGEGKTYTDGGWDAYLERYYYNTILPTPNTLFHSSLFPPNGTNYYYIDDPVIDKALEDYAGAIDEASHMDAIKRFQKRWYETEPITILFYPEDVIAIDPKWGKVLKFDSYKWQHVCYNLKHPVFGTGVETPLGKQDPSRAAEAAAYLRKAIILMMPREQIVKEIVNGYGQVGTVPIPYSAAEYDHELLKPIPYDLELAKQYMEKAGYKY